MTDNDKALRQLHYQLTRDDLAAFEIQPRELQGLQKLWLFGPVLMCGAAVGVFEDQLRTVLPWDPASRAGQIATVLLAIALGYGLAMIGLTWRTRRRIAQAHVPATPTIVDVYPQILLATQDEDQFSYLWNKLTLVETPEHLFLTQGSRRPVIIPRRAFESAEDMEQFAMLVETLRNAQDIATEHERENPGSLS